jgi:hypothetical protein
MNKRWPMILSIWVIVTVLALVTMLTQSTELALTGFGAILAISVAAVSLIHLFRASPQNFVNELVYVAGGSFLILAVASVYLLLKG